ELKEEVQVHAPTEFEGGGRSTSGKLITKPVSRQKVRLTPVAIAAMVAVALTILGVSWAAGELIRDNLAVRIAGLLVVSPVLVVAAYWFLRNEDLEPYRGVPLYVRATICGVVYAALWGAYSYLAGMVLSPEPELWQWMFIVPPLLGVGGIVPLVSLDLDYGNGFFHYVFYVLLTIVLGWLAGMGWPWDPTVVM
ncbi:MAG TPA: hypothetical protein VE890_06960, partial [Thermoguttaceae bacterium]|nr:hypothetical protein [Thermoguttaceae bacterium]